MKKFILFAIIGGLSLFGIFYLAFFSFFKSLAPKQSFLYSVYQPNPKAEKRETGEMVERLNKEASQSAGTLGVSVYNLIDQTSFGINEDSVFVAASTAKIPIAVTVFKKSEEGAVNLQSGVKIDLEDIQDYGASVLVYRDDDSVYTVRKLIDLALTESDNTSAYVLAKKVLTLEQIEKSLESWGYTRFDMEENKTTPGEMTRFLKDLYQLRLLNRERTGEIFDLLSKVKHNSRIPKYLPDTIKIAHKEGTQVRAFSDVGVVFAEKPYVVSLYAEDTEQEAGEELLARVSKLIYDFETK